MNRKQFREIAKMYGVSVEDVKADMEEALDAAYQNPTSEALKVPCEGQRPTIYEFIYYCSQMIK